MPNITPISGEALKAACNLLQAGELVAMPTETVYGLAGDARQDKAVAKIFALKGRPHFNPLIVHAATAKEALAEAASSAQNDPRAQSLSAQFWPGPLTLILPRHENSKISELACAGLPTIALRVPAHADAQALLRAFGGLLAAPSANRSGRLSPTTPLHVAAEFNDEVPLILAGGKSSIGIESTVLDLTGATPVILRPGAITRDALQRTLEMPVAEAASDPHLPKSPGQMAKHYAPQTKLRLNKLEAAPEQAMLSFGPVLGKIKCKAELNLSVTGDLTEAAANLFSMLRQLDAVGATEILVMPIPQIGLGIAINDRLARAATKDE